jgi:hypothetical protein
LLKEQGIALVAQITEEKIMGHESGSELAIALSTSKETYSESDKCVERLARRRVSQNYQTYIIFTTNFKIS